jgi:fluoride ion exporter CrcB/FEX
MFRKKDHSFFIGALAHYGLGTVLTSPGGSPLPTPVINLAGAFLRGVLLEALIRCSDGHLGVPGRSSSCNLKDHNPS